MSGRVSGRAGPNFFSGQVRCADGLHLVGNPVITFREGVWGGSLPVCGGGWMWVEVVVMGIIIVLITSYWDLPCPAPGGEWENYSYRRIKRVCSQVYLLPGV